MAGRTSKPIAVYPGIPSHKTDRAHAIKDGQIRCGKSVQEYRPPVTTTFSKFKNGDHGKACSQCIAIVSGGD